MACSTATTEQASEAREVSYAEYLAREERSETKHEWVDGVVYAMSGGTLAHNQLSAQMIVELSRLESLKHYVLVSQHERCIEVYSRDAEGGWGLREGADGESVALEALGGALEVDRVYRNVTLTPSARASE